MDKEALEIILSIEENKDLLESVEDGIFDHEQLTRFVELTTDKTTKHSLYNSINANQRKSKRWLIEILSTVFTWHKPYYGIAGSSVLILGGWYGGLASMLKRKFSVEMVRCIDIDPICKKYGRLIYNGEVYIQFRCLDFIDYPIQKKYHDLIISTSCEHFKREDLIEFINKTPKGISFCLQSNNYYGIEEHINCSDSLEDFVKYLPLHSMLAVELEFEKYKRFMVIGKK